MNAVEDLAAWLTAIWDERQRVYEYPPDFVEDSGSARGPGWGKIGGDTCEVCNSYQFSGYESVVEDEWYEHMEKYHSRSEVLARIAADRKILALAVKTIADAPPRGYDWDSEYAVARASAFEDVLFLKAEQYADREGFRPEWLVERQGVEG